MKKYKETMIIKDKDFLREYLEFNLSYRYIVAEACFKSFDKGNWAIKKAIGIEIISQYVSSLEDIAMFYYAMKNKKEEESFLKTLKKISIKESSSSNYSTEKIAKELDELEKIDFDDFILKLHMPPKKYLKKKRFQKLIKQFGGIDKAYNQYIEELKLALSQLKLAISNRIKDKNGQEFPLKEVLNRVKHGLLFLNDISNQESIIFPIKFVSESSNDTEISFINLICNKKALLIDLIKQMKIITDTFKKILHTYYIYHYSDR